MWGRRGSNDAGADCSTLWPGSASQGDRRVTLELVFPALGTSLPTDHAYNTAHADARVGYGRGSGTGGAHNRVVSGAARATRRCDEADSESDEVRTLVSRLDLERYKATLKGLTGQFPPVLPGRSTGGYVCCKFRLKISGEPSTSNPLREDTFLSSPGISRIKNFGAVASAPGRPTPSRGRERADCHGHGSPTDPLGGPRVSWTLRMRLPPRS